MHWILIHNKKKLIGEVGTRKEGENRAIEFYGMTLDQAEKFRRSLVISLPRKGVIEIVACECLDHKHEGEI